MRLSRRTFLVRGGLAVSGLGLTTLSCANRNATRASKDMAPRATVGAYYFDGWAGKNSHAGDPAASWAKTAPTHLTKRMVEEFPEREPVWGWRDDNLQIMERQIDLAADHGITFFAFCWYWHPDLRAIEEDPKHIGLKLFLQAKNNRRMKYCLLVANHEGFLLRNPSEWERAGEICAPLFRHPQHLTVDGKPLVIIFNPRNGKADDLEALQASVRKSGIPGVAIAGCGAGDLKSGYTLRTHYNLVPGYASGSEQRPYEELVKYHQKAWHGSKEQPYIPEVTAGWDKRPWEGPEGLGQKPGSYFPDRTPQAFGDFLESAIDWMDKHPEETPRERLVLIYAWNEFGEGGYIAPTRGDPQGKYLQAIERVLSAGKSK